MKFFDNKYTRWYFKIITAAQANNSNSAQYHEKHHIIPRCFGGDNHDSNIAKLTARQHFICHLLLTKMVSGKNKSKMCFALNMMLVKRTNTPRYIPASRLYEYARKMNSEAQHSKIVSETARIAIGNAHRGKIVSVETRKKQSLARKGKPGRPQSTEERAARSVARTGVCYLSNESKAMIGQKHKGKKIAQETRAKMTATRKQNYVSTKILILTSPNGEVITQDPKQTGEDFCSSLNLKYQTVKLSIDLQRTMHSGWVAAFK